MGEDKPNVFNIFFRQTHGWKFGSECCPNMNGLNFILLHFFNGVLCAVPMLESVWQRRFSCWDRLKHLFVII